jgi:hypothetical protein
MSAFQHSLGGLRTVVLSTVVVLILAHGSFVLATQEQDGGQADVSVSGSEGKSVELDPKTGIPVLPGANEQAYRREVTTLALMGAMGVVCTLLAFLAVWMLQRNSQSTLGAIEPARRRPGEDD